MGKQLKDMTTPEVMNEVLAKLGARQHNLKPKNALWEMIEHFSGIGHLEVLGIAKGSAPVKGDYDKWLASPAGKKAAKENDLNAAYNALIPKVFAQYQKVNVSGADEAKIKQAGKQVVTLVKDFKKKNNLWDSYWPEVEAAYKELKKRVA